MSCSGSACGKPKSFIDLSWSNKDTYDFGSNNYDGPGADIGVSNKYCNNDPTVHVCGYVNTNNVGNIPMHGSCSYQNRVGFYKKQYEDTRRLSEYQGKPGNHLRISQTYLGDISPMFGAKTAYENVYGSIIKPVHVDTSTVLVYPDGPSYPQHQYI